MGTRFEDYAARRKAAWSDDQRAVYEAASAAFAAEHDRVARLGRDLAERRKQLNLTQPDLAAISGLQQSEISRIERGLANPTLSTISPLLAALQLDFAVAPIPESATTA